MNHEFTLVDSTEPWEFFECTDAYGYKKKKWSMMIRQKGSRPNYSRGQPICPTTSSLRESTDEPGTQITRHPRYPEHQGTAILKREPKDKVKLTIVSAMLPRIAGLEVLIHLDLSFHIGLA